MVSSINIQDITIEFTQQDRDNYLATTDTVIATINRKANTVRTWEYSVSITTPEGVVLDNGQDQSITKCQDQIAQAVEQALVGELEVQPQKAPAPPLTNISELLPTTPEPITTPRVRFIPQTGGVEVVRREQAPSPLPTPMDLGSDYGIQTHPDIKERRQGRRQYPGNMVITRVVPNPKREGSEAHRRFALLKDGQTIQQAMDLGVWYGDIRGGFERGFLHLSFA